MPDLPTWRPRPYPEFRQSGNIDDRRDTSEAAEWARALLTAMTADASATVPASTPLAAAAGAGDIERSHGLWLLRQAMEAQRAIQADPTIRSFNEKIDPAAPPVRMDRRKLPFGLGG